MTTELESMILKAVKAYLDSNAGEGAQLAAILRAGKLVNRLTKLTNEAHDFYGGRP